MRERVKFLVRELDLTYSLIARYLNLTPSYFIKYVKADRNLSIEKQKELYQICNVLDESLIQINKIKNRRNNVYEKS